MSEPAKKLARQAEERLDRVARLAQQFDKITEGRFSDLVKDGRFADQVDHGVDRGRADARRAEQDARRQERGGSAA
ncbi:hypothetical protein MCAG_02994 [Micromonospora sp. ATCC 39149]|uniref:Uncharacterized protein n=1 Tax=Micromonospora carbonacea TaxID=47853 RepID=A0A7D5YIK6_9ACTN|nr:hypothetical protein [Micromonospora sp. ATCC 39149]EEP72667.1 hypothetical protein MCAG_02994 [Micromonospora sp. ATCC 39149]QLJ98774.1 hypothetical protein HZU44_00625 [Micromonospora carbonacea]